MSVICLEDEKWRLRHYVIIIFTFLEKEQKGSGIRVFQSQDLEFRDPKGDIDPINYVFNLQFASCVKQHLEVSRLYDDTYNLLQPPIINIGADALCKCGVVGIDKNEIDNE